MKTVRQCLIFVTLLSGLAYDHCNQALAATDASPADFTVTERRAHETVWTRALAVSTGDGNVRWETNSYVEIASGLNRLNAAGKYERADASFSITKDGYAVADRAQHRLRVSPRLDDAEGAIQITTPDGKTLRLTPSALVVADRASGKTLVLGEITNTVGLLVAPNTILFTNVLGSGPDSFKASLRIVNAIGSVHADVILHERLEVDSLKNAGFDPATSEIQIWHAFLGTDEPQIERRVLQREDRPEVRARMQEPDVINDDLNWGAFRMPMGRAYLYDGERQVDQSVNVTKQWIQAEDGSHYLVEKIPLPVLEPLFAQMSPPARPFDLESQERLYARDWRPEPRFEQKQSETILLAQSRAALTGQPQLILDPVMVSSQPNYTFKGDVTYYVSSPVSLSGITTIEGGTVIKYNNTASSSISIYGPVQCLTDAYRPAVFTSKFDSSVGENWVTGTPANYGGSALYLFLPSVGPNATLSNLQVAYANTGIDVGTDQGETITLRNVRFVNCTTAVREGGYYNYPNVNIFNGLIHNASTAFSVWYGGNLTAQHLTINGCAALAEGSDIQYYASTFNFANSIFASVGSLDTGDINLSGNINGFYPSTPMFGANPVPSSSTPFPPTVGAGAHYLEDFSSFHFQGTKAGIDGQLLAELKKKTTYPPTELSGPITTLSPPKTRMCYGTRPIFPTWAGITTRWIIC